MWKLLTLLCTIHFYLCTVYKAKNPSVRLSVMLITPWDCRFQLIRCLTHSAHHPPTKVFMKTEVIRVLAGLSDVSRGVFWLFFGSCSTSLFANPVTYGHGMVLKSLGAHFIRQQYMVIGPSVAQVFSTSSRSKFHSLCRANGSTRYLTITNLE